MLRIDRIWNNENHPVAIELQTKDGQQTIEFKATFQFAQQLEHLCDCLTTGKPHRIPPENSINQMRVIDAVLKSMATGKAVEL